MFLATIVSTCAATVAAAHVSTCGMFLAATVAAAHVSTCGGMFLAATVAAAHVSTCGDVPCCHCGGRTCVNLWGCSLLLPHVCQHVRMFLAATVAAARVSTCGDVPCCHCGGRTCVNLWGCSLLPPWRPHVCQHAVKLEAVSDPGQVYRLAVFLRSLYVSLVLTELRHKGRLNVRFYHPTPYVIIFCELQRTAILKLARTYHYSVIK